MSIALERDMLRTTLRFLLTSTLVAACTDRSEDAKPDPMATAGDDAGTGYFDGDYTDGGDGSGDADDDDDDGDSADESDGTSGDCEGEECDDEGPACEGDPRWCVPDDDGDTCSHGPDFEATCEGGQWVCPEGFAFEEDVDCTPDGERDCLGAGCWIPCEPGDTPPDECWDQGPGECSDATVAPSCDRGMWTCPNGFDFGGFGESCTFPGG